MSAVPNHKFPKKFFTKLDSAEDCLKSALTISKLLEYYAAYAEIYGFDRAILNAAIRALRYELNDALFLVEEKKTKDNGSFKRKK